MSISLSEQELQRRQNLQSIINLGINPYPADEYKVNVTAADILANYERDKISYKNIRFAGRIMSRRTMGNASFIELQDSTGPIQCDGQRHGLCPTGDVAVYRTLFHKLMGIGASVGVEGYVFTRQAGELSIHTENLAMLAKPVRPLPLLREA